MNRTFSTLLVAAIGVWFWVCVQVILLWRGTSPQQPQSRMERLALPPMARPVLAARVAELPLKRDPFQSFLFSEKPAPPKPAGHSRPAAAAPIAPPDITVDGILMGSPPVAILKRAGKTELAKEGQEVWEVTVTKITDHEVVVRKQGRAFTLTYP